MRQKRIYAYLSQNMLKTKAYGVRLHFCLGGIGLYVDLCLAIASSASSFCPSWLVYSPCILPQTTISLLSTPYDPMLQL